MSTRIDELWRQVAESPEDLAPRLVLADALAELGDSRGELILLQCGESADARAAASDQIQKLITENWSRWLGKLALVLAHEGTFWHQGMLETVQVGQLGTPDSAYDRLAGHRELACVRNVRPARVDATNFAKFIIALPHDPVSVNIHSARVLDELGARKEQWSTRCVRYGNRSGYSESLDFLAIGIAATFPKLAELELLSLGATYNAGEQLLSMIPWLAARLPHLESIVIHESQYIEDRLGPGGLDPLRAIPIVSLH